MKFYKLQSEKNKKKFVVLKKKYNVCKIFQRNNSLNYF